MDNNNSAQLEVSNPIDNCGVERFGYLKRLAEHGLIVCIRAKIVQALAELRASNLNAKRLLVHDSEWFLLFGSLGIVALLFCRQIPAPNQILLIAAIVSCGLTKFKATRYLFIFLVALAWGSWSLQQHWMLSLPFELESKNIVVRGHVSDLPSRNTSRTRFRFKIDQLTATEQGESSLGQELHGQMIELSCYRCPFDILPQQEWSFTVRLKRPHGYASWGAFDFEKYLFRHKLVARGYVRLKEKNQFISEGAWSVNKLRWQVKQQLSRQLSDYDLGNGLGHGVGQAMIAALLIGDKSLLENRHKRTFQATGVSHLMAISGLHVGLVFLFVCQLLKWLLMPFAKIFDTWPRQYIVLPPALFAAFLYSAMAGFAVSTQRAFTMLCVFVICRLFARENGLLRVLLIAASIILVLDPFSILDVGFWLSCGAVLIIAIAGLRFENLALYKLQPILWAGMLPMSLAFFGQVSLISPFVNLLMVPLFCTLLIPLVLLAFSLSQIGLQSISEVLIVSLAKTFEAIYWLLESISELSFALIYPTPYSLTIGALLILVVHSVWRRSRVMLVIAGVSLLGLVLIHDDYQLGEVDITLLDVGQGLSMVVQAKNYVLVYDTGPAYGSGFNTASAVLIPYLRDQGISEIDTLIVSHADNDHIGGYPVLSQTFPIGEILTSRLDRIPNARSCEAGQAWRVSEIEFEIISPQSDTPQGSNNLSCVLRISNGAFRALLTGDIEKPVEQFLLATAIDLKADFLLVPHQGSKTSSSAKFIDAVDPIVGFIAAGYRNHYGHPHAGVVGRYKSRAIGLMSTVDNGSILLKFNDKGWLIERFRVQEKGFWHRQKMPN